MPAATSLNEYCKVHQVAPRLSTLWSVLAWKVASIQWPQAWHLWQLASAHILVPPEDCRPALAAAGLSSQHGFSQGPPSSTHAATNLKAPCSSNQVPPRPARMAANISLHHSPFHEAPESTHLVAHFTPHQRTTQPAPHMTHLRSRLVWHQSSPKVTPPQGPHNSLCARPAFTASRLRVSPTHWPAHGNRGLATTGRHTQPTQGILQEHPAQGTREKE